MFCLCSCEARFGVCGEEIVLLFEAGEKERRGL
jgi:hypothetical protein